MLSETLQENFSFKATGADPDVHWRPVCNDGFEFCKCVFVHVHDLLILLKEPMHWIEKLGVIRDMKEESVGPPDAHLGAQLERLNCPIVSLRGTLRLMSVSRMQFRKCKSH